MTKIQPAGIRTKSGGARSIEGGKGPAGSGLSLGVAGVENGGRKDATFLRARHGDLKRQPGSEEKDSRGGLEFQCLKNFRALPEDYRNLGVS